MQEGWCHHHQYHHFHVNDLKEKSLQQSKLLEYSYKWGEYNTPKFYIMTDWSDLLMQKYIYVNKTLG